MTFGHRKVCLILKRKWSSDLCFCWQSHLPQISYIFVLKIAQSSHFETWFFLSSNRRNPSRKGYHRRPPFFGDYDGSFHCKSKRDTQFHNRLFKLRIQFSQGWEQLRAQVGRITWRASSAQRCDILAWNSRMFWATFWMTVVEIIGFI